MWRIDSRAISYCILVSLAGLAIALSVAHSKAKVSSLGGDEGSKCVLGKRGLARGYCREPTDFCKFFELC